MRTGRREIGGEGESRTGREEIGGGRESRTGRDVAHSSFRAGSWSLRPDRGCFFFRFPRSLRAARVRALFSTRLSLSRSPRQAATLEWVEREYVSRNVPEIPVGALKAFLLQALASGGSGGGYASSPAATLAAGPGSSHPPSAPPPLAATYAAAGPATALGGPTSLADPDAEDDVIAIDMDQGGGAGRRTPGGAHWID